MVTAQTAQFYKDIQKLMRGTGYKYKRVVASAQEELNWTKDGKDTITLSGWHGQRGWGPEKLLLTFTIWNPKTYKHVSVDNVTDFDDCNKIDGCSLTANGVATYQTKLDQVRAKIVGQIG